MKITFKIDESITEEPLIEIQYQKYDDTMTELLQYIQNFPTKKPSLTIKQDDSYHIINKADIIYLEVQRDFIRIQAVKEVFVFRGRFYKIMAELNSQNFIQVAKSVAINLTYLVKLEASFSGNMNAVLKDGSVINISRTYLKNLKQHLHI